LKTGNITTPQRKNLTLKGQKDIESGLSLDLIITNYTSNKETKSFIEREALKIKSGLKKKPGAKYRLNRWREEQINNGKKITYRDLVNQYIKLNETVKPFEKIPHGRYINFLADYVANEKDATKANAIKIWKALKKMDIPKTYKAWKIEMTKKN
jgi:hypothetical protein